MEKVSEIAIKSRAAGFTNDKFIPYYAKFYDLPQQVLDLLPDPEVSFNTPAFTKDSIAFSTHEEILSYIQKLEEQCEFMEVETIGHSMEGRPIPLIKFMKDPSNIEKPIVWIQAQVHGNEPAAGESALVIAERLACGGLGTEILDDLNVIIIPQINPDSSYYFERNSVKGLNGNREHINLEMPELQAAHLAFNQYSPEVVIDTHEYSATPQYKNIGEKGSMKYHDVTILSGKNLNIPKEIREKSDEWFVANAFNDLEKQGYSHGGYYVVTASDTQKPTILEGGTDPGTGRNTFGLKPSFSFLVESLGIGVGRDTFLRRVNGQVIAQESILRKTKEHAAEIKAIIRQAKQAIIAGSNKGLENDKVIIKSQLKERNDITSIKAIDIAKGEVFDLPIRYYSSTEATPTLERVRPNAYIIPPAFHLLAEKLTMQGVTIQKLTDARELNVECYSIDNVENDNKKETPILNVTTSLKTEKRFFAKGSFIIPCSQVRANIISLALEPESEASFIANGFVNIFMNDEIPIYRYMEEIDFDVAE